MSPANAIEPCGMNSIALGCFKSGGRQTKRRGEREESKRLRFKGCWQNINIKRLLPDRQNINAPPII
jgi:hypothetical protein